MKSMLLVLVAAAGCGTSDPATWEKCTASGCADPSAKWDVIADGADITGDNYDVVGPPDPYLCLGFGGHSYCSSSISDNSQPRWDETIVHSALASALTAGELTVALWDKDTGGLDTDDFICSTSITITADDLAAGGIQLSCTHATAELQFHFDGFDGDN